MNQEWEGGTGWHMNGVIDMKWKAGTLKPQVLGDSLDFPERSTWNTDSCAQEIWAQWVEGTGSLCKKLIWTKSFFFLFSNSIPAASEKAGVMQRQSPNPQLVFFTVFTTVMVWMLRGVIYTAIKVNNFFSSNICSKYITVSKMECRQVISFEDRQYLYILWR